MGLQVACRPRNREDRTCDSSRHHIPHALWGSTSRQQVLQCFVLTAEHGHSWWCSAGSVHSCWPYQPINPYVYVFIHIYPMFSKKSQLLLLLMGKYLLCYNLSGCLSILAWPSFFGRLNPQSYALGDWLRDSHPWLVIDALVMYPLVNMHKAIKAIANGHWNSGFTH